MKCKFISLAFIFLLLLSCGKSEDETLRVVTGSVTDITPFSAVLHGYGYPPASMGTVPFGFIYSMNETPAVYGGTSIWTLSRNRQELEAVNFEYSAKISDLHPGVTYYYRATTVFNGWLMGDIKSFTTKPMEASVSLLPVSLENPSSVTLSAKLDTEYMDLLKGTFFLVYSEKEYLIAEIEANRPNYRQMAPCDLSNGIFSILQTAIKPSHEYFYVAGAILYDRVFYSPIGSFTISSDTALTSHSLDR